jgi:hypothetical protein
MNKVQHKCKEHVSKTRLLNHYTVVHILYPEQSV